MSKKLIFQINVPHHVQTDKITAYTFMSDMYEVSEKNARRYAKRCGAHYYKLTNSDDYKPAAGRHLDYQKLKIFDFEEYDQILYLDSDYIIKDNAPNLFELYKDQFCAVTDPGKTVDELAANLGIPRDRYFNAGFMYIPKLAIEKTKDKVLDYLKTEYEYQGQGLLNKLFYDAGVEYFALDGREWNPVKKTFGTYADHYAGAKKKKWGQVTY